MQRRMPPRLDPYRDYPSVRMTYKKPRGPRPEKDGQSKKKRHAASWLDQLGGDRAKLEAERRAALDAKHITEERFK